VAGRILDSDKERVRDLNRIEDVVGEYVALKSAGGGNLKGLCPFHDEKSPSFNVRPSHGSYHCFGCGQGGDVFTFIVEMEHIAFPEALERLADRVGYVLTRVEGGSSVRVDRGTRTRLIQANKAAAQFYAEQLTTDAAEPARRFLADRGFDMAAAELFGCGFAPGGWDNLVKALTKQGFTLPELYKAGLAREGRQGAIDRFHRRLLWSIRDAAGDVVGFGARRLFDDDQIEAKYINTSDTQLYHKSQVLFGLDLAKREIAKQRTVVVVEGYTDVMAMHAAGVLTAVASCGTAFGDEHIGVLRRYLMDSEVIRGEVIYTFDGDTAGQNAALKAFDSDQKFAANTFVAIAPDGMDPCDLRLSHGDAAVADLVASRKPLFAFAVRSTLAGYNLDTAEGRVAATRATVPMVARIKDGDVRDQYVNELAGWLGAETADIRARVRAAVRNPPPPPKVFADRRVEAAEPVAPEGPPRPNPKDRALFSEREALKLALQQPDQLAGAYEQIEVAAYTNEAYAMLHTAIEAAGGCESGLTGAAWMAALDAHLPRGTVASLLTELSVEPLRYSGDESVGHYAGAVLASLAARVAAVSEAELRSALQRAAADRDQEQVLQIQNDLIAVQAYRRALDERARGES